MGTNELRRQTLEQAESKERKKEKGNARRRHGQNNDFEGNSWETDPRKGKRDDSLAIMGKRRERGEKKMRTKDTEICKDSKRVESESYERWTDK